MVFRIAKFAVVFRIAKFRIAKFATHCEQFAKIPTVLPSDFVLRITFLGVFGTVGKLRECRIQIYPERTFLSLL